MDAAVSTKTEDTMRVDEEKARIISAFYDTAVSPCTLWIMLHIHRLLIFLAAVTRCCITLARAGNLPTASAPLSSAMDQTAASFSSFYPIIGTRLRLP